MVSITFMVNFYDIYGWYYIYFFITFMGDTGLTAVPFSGRSHMKGAGISHVKYKKLQCRYSQGAFSHISNRHIEWLKKEKRKRKIENRRSISTSGKKAFLFIQFETTHPNLIAQPL